MLVGSVVHGGTNGQNKSISHICDTGNQAHLGGYGAAPANAALLHAMR